jgi:glycosyltransferase involved in cell wall biosynthesis
VDRTHRVALVASHVIQYQDPFFRLLASAPDLDLTVLFCSSFGAQPYLDTDMQTTLRWDLEMLQGYHHRFLRNFGSGEGYARLINPGIVPALLFGRYDAVIFFLGWGTISSLLGIAACRAAGTPILLFGDSSHPPAEDSTARRLRAGAMRTLFGMADGFLVSGILNAEYYRHYGADPSRFFDVPWAIDNDRFVNASRFGQGEREAMRARMGISPDQALFVFSAKFIPRKDPLTLLRALDRMRHRDRAAVLFLGHGELRADMEHFVREHGLRAHFAGFVNQTDLPKYYAAGDAFVLSSTYEPRGTVVNEAMACGLPLIVTDVYGAIGDIASERENTLIFKPGDVEALAAHLDRLVEDPELRAGMARKSREIIDGWNYERGVAGIGEALRSIC